MSSKPSRIPFHVEPEDSGWAEPLSRRFLSLHSVERRPQLNHPPIASLGRARTTSLSFRVRSSRAIPCVETNLASRDLGRQPSPVLSHATRVSLARAAFLDSISALRSPTVVASQASTLRRTDLLIRLLSFVAPRLAPTRCLGSRVGFEQVRDAEISCSTPRIYCGNLLYDPGKGKSRLENPALGFREL